jgi:hypothetical protein
VKDVGFSDEADYGAFRQSDKDRVTTFPASMIRLLENNLAKVEVLHTLDLSEGRGKFICPMRSAASTQALESSWDGSICSPPAMCRPIR